MSKVRVKFGAKVVGDFDVVSDNTATVLIEPSELPFHFHRGEKFLYRDELGNAVATVVHQHGVTVGLEEWSRLERAVCAAAKTLWTVHER